METLTLPEGKVLNVKSLCNKAILPPTTSHRQVARVLGMLQSCEVVSATTFPLPRLAIQLIHAFSYNGAEIRGGYFP